MRAVVASDSTDGLIAFRQVLHNAGLECPQENCVSTQELPRRLAQGEADIVIIRAADLRGWSPAAAQQARGLTSAKFVAVGSSSDRPTAEQLKPAVIDEFVDEANLRGGMDQVVGQLTSVGEGRARRGLVIAVVAPIAGSGRTTIAANLAAAFKARKGAGDVALIDLAGDAGTLPLLLNIEPPRSVADVCRRWGELDAMSLAQSMAAHPSGLAVLAQPVAEPRNTELSVAAVQRIAMLARLRFDATVLRLDAAVGDAEIEAMRLADAILVVLRPDVIAVRRGQELLRALDDADLPAERIALVVNRWGEKGQLSLAQLKAGLNRDPAATIDDAPAVVNRAANQGRLLREQSAVAKIVRQLDRLAASLLDKKPAAIPKR